MLRAIVITLTFLFAALFVLGWCMRIMHWPGHTFVRYAGLLGGAIMVVILISMKKEKKKKDDLDDRTLDSSFGKD